MSIEERLAALEASAAGFVKTEAKAGSALVERGIRAVVHFLGGGPLAESEAAIREVRKAFAHEEHVEHLTAHDEKNGTELLGSYLEAHAKEAAGAADNSKAAKVAALKEQLAALEA